MTEAIWANILSAIPPTLVALGALVASMRAGKTSKRVEQSVNGSLDQVLTDLEKHVIMVRETRDTLSQSIKHHESQLLVLRLQLDKANAHIEKLIMTPEDYLAKHPPKPLT
jgi:hypothetical protein